MSENKRSNNSFKSLIAILVILLWCNTFQAQDSYADYVKQYMSSLRKYKNECDSAFSVMLKQQWEHFDAQQGREPKKIPTPPIPYVIKNPTKPIDFEIKIATKPIEKPILVVKPKPQEKPTPKPPKVAIKPQEKPKTTVPTADKPPITKPSTETPKPQVQDNSIESYGKGNCNIQFYGTSINILIPTEMRVSLSNLSENEISKSWDLLSNTEYKSLINDLKDAKKALKLNDWLYVKMVKEIAEKWENKRRNEANLLAMFILLQSGYKVKVANFSGQLALLYASSNLIFAVDYLTLDGEHYYILDDLGGSNLSCTTYRGNFGSNLNNVSLILDKTPITKSTPTESVKRSNGVINLTTSMNKNLVDIYNDFPLCDYSVYLNTPLSKELQRDVLAPLKSQIAGMNELTSVETLLSFVQKGFDYKTDHAQFGRERPFFIDENFFYPYNDCEDRSMMFSILIKELLGLDVILLEYPNHIATAVCFNSDIKGDFVMFENKRYTVCDPTCINAKVGVTMPQFRKTTPEAKRY